MASVRGFLGCFPYLGWRFDKIFPLAHAGYEMAIACLLPVIFLRCHAFGSRGPGSSSGIRRRAFPFRKKRSMPFSRHLENFF